MVGQTSSLFVKIGKVAKKYSQRGFLDTLRILVSGGTGGNGLAKFGGIGGQGGDVKIIGKNGINLHDVFMANKTKLYEAKSGKHSSHNFILGPSGETLKFDVPVGVTVFTEFGKKLGEINQDGEELLIAKGGSGGNSKNGFLGTKGQKFPVILDLKLIADVGLVGFPNAGKSTLLKAISHAKPKIASYPFTTIRPNLGIIHFKDFRQISMADLPGIIEGAYANKGMGHNFLKHVERTKLLLMIVDINGFQLSPQYPHRSCLDTILLLNKELELYNTDLLHKPAMLIVNKMDTKNAQEIYEKLKEDLTNLTEIVKSSSEEVRPENIIEFKDIIPISAKESVADIDLVKQRLRQLVDSLAKEEKPKDNSDFYRITKESLHEKGPNLV